MDGGRLSAAPPSARIAYTRPSVTALETGYVADAAANGWGEHCHAWLHRFEAAFAAHLGVRHAVATSSCTGALHLGLAALGGPGIGPGDEVILADANWVATAAPIVQLGATPVFVDIRPDSWCIDAGRVAAAITPRTRAIVAVHLYGNLCEMDRLLAIGARHGIPVVEDAAEAIGSVWHGGRRAGSLGAFGAFSFHGTKTLSTGEGGMFVSDDDALHERVLTLSNHGRARSQPRQFWAERVGFKYKMSNLQAALGCAQLERVDELVGRKRDILRRYRELLAGCAGITMNAEPAGTVNGAWMPTLVFDRATGVTRERLQAAFAAADIDARVFFWPLSSTPGFGSHAGQPVAADIASRAINLPSFHDITDAEQQRVAACVRQALGGAAAAAAAAAAAGSGSAAPATRSAQTAPAPADPPLPPGSGPGREPVPAHG